MGLMRTRTKGPSNSLLRGSTFEREANFVSISSGFGSFIYLYFGYLIKKSFSMISNLDLIELMNYSKKKYVKIITMIFKQN